MNLNKLFEYSWLHFMKCPAHVNGVVRLHVSFGQVWLDAFWQQRQQEIHRVQWSYVVYLLVLTRAKQTVFG